MGELLIDFFCLRKKFLVFNLVSRNIKIRYRRSILGLFWTLVGPLSQALTFFLVFRIILNIQIPHYMVMILSGVLPWTFFSGTIIEGMESIVGNVGLVTKVPIPVQVFPIVVVTTNLVTLVLALPVLLGAAIVSHVPLSWSFLAIVPLFLILALIAYSISLLASILFVYFRDLRHLMAIAIQLLFYATPVIYEASMIPPQYRWLLYVNPVGNIFAALHQVMVRAEWPSLEQLGVSIAWALGLSIVALYVRRTAGQELVEQI